MEKEFDKVKEQVANEISTVDDSKKLYELRMAYLNGKTGYIASLMSGLRNATKEERPALGKTINLFKAWLEKAFDSAESTVKQKELEAKNSSERVDISMPGIKREVGAMHPVTVVRNQLIDIFSGMGFEIYEGREIESEYYNFTALNTPEDHPARDRQDTFYITEKLLLRTQTSAGQIHVMEEKRPPIKILSPGRVFRSDDDATHTPMFHQMEGLVVDRGLTLCDLQGMLDMLAKSMFSDDVRTRFRPSYFPFTEPSVEVDVSCCECHGKGCSLCKGTGWIEILGAGVVNRRVLENCNIDPDEYTGFAFGIGIERITMLKYGINNIKILFDNDLRTLRQFS